MSDEYNEQGWTTAKEPCACDYAILADGQLQHEPACRVPELEHELKVLREARRSDLQTIDNLRACYKTLVRYS